MCLGVTPAYRTGLPGERWRRAARSSGGCQTQTPSNPAPPASPPGVCPGNQTPRWRHTVCYSVWQTKTKGETLQLTDRVINKPSDRVKSQLTTVDDVLTHRSNARGHDERNCHQVGGSRQLEVTRTGSQESIYIYILTSAGDNSLYVSEHTSLVTCSTRVQVQVALWAARTNRQSDKKRCNWSTERQTRGWRSTTANGLPSTSKSAMASANRERRNCFGLSDTPSHDRHQSNQHGRWRTYQLIVLNACVCFIICWCTYLYL